MKERKFQTKRLTVLAMFAAISILLVYCIHFPLFPATPFLEYDPADIPILLGTLLYGPLPGLALTFVVSVIQGLTVSAQSGVIGIIMHFVATGSFVLVTGFLCRKNRSRGRVILSLLAGVLVMTAVMSLWNLILTPIFMKAPREMVLELMLPAILPFNFIKAGVNGLIAYLLFRSLQGLRIIDKIGE